MDWNGAYFMHSVPSEGQVVQIILASCEMDTEASENWQRIVSADNPK